MPLTTPIAQNVGAAIASALADLPRGEDVSEDAWKIVVTKIFEAIVANGLVTIPAGSILTTGGPASQAGPAAPLPLTIT